MSGAVAAAASARTRTSAALTSRRAEQVRTPTRRSVRVAEALELDDFDGLQARYYVFMYIKGTNLYREII